MVTTDELTALMRPGALRELVEEANGSPRSAPPEPLEEAPQSKPRDAIIFREVCHYCISKAPILGTLTLTRESLIFEPDARDAAVDERGCSYYQVHLDLVNIEECGLIGVSTDEVDIYEEGSIHCNGMLQLLLKKTGRIFPLDDGAEIPRETGPRVVKDDQPAPSEDPTLSPAARAAELVTQGISKLTSVVNIGGFRLGTKSQPESPRMNADAATPKKTFVIFGFFAKEVAHRCTLALMDALDEAKSREEQFVQHEGLSSVPFTSNSLLEILTKTLMPASQAPTERSRTQSLNYGPENVNEHSATDDGLSQVLETDNQLRKSVAERSRILTLEMVSELMEELPPALTIRNWELSFETLHDGVSFCTLYKKLDGHEHCLLVVKDDKGAVFGAFTGHIALSYKYYGTAETFVFKFVGGRIRVYKARGANRCFVYSDDKTIIFGGGVNSALAIDDAFRSGTSGVSDTFRNEQLSESLMFNIAALEVWTFGSYLT